MRAFLATARESQATAALCGHNPDFQSAELSFERIRASYRV